MRGNAGHKTTIIGLGALIALALWHGAAIAAPLAYVPNEGSGTISVIDTDQDAVIKEIKAGTKPRGIATGKDAKSLYVSDQPHNALLVVDLDKQQVAQSIDLCESHESVAMSPDGKG